MSGWESGWRYDRTEHVEPDPVEHTDRRALQLEQDADSAAINAAMEGLE